MTELIKNVQFLSRVWKLQLPYEQKALIIQKQAALYITERVLEKWAQAVAPLSWGGAGSETWSVERPVIERCIPSDTDNVRQ